MWYVNKITALLKPQNRNEYFSQTFHYSCMDLMAFAQCLELFPLSDVHHTNPQKLKFKWLSFKMLYSVLLFALIFLCSVTSIYKAFSRGTVFYSLVSPLFNVHINGTIILFIMMSKRWPAFLCKIAELEKSFLKKYKSNTNMRRKINIFAILANISVTVAHALSVVNFTLTSNCDNNATDLEYYFRKQFHYIFEDFPYSAAFGILLLVANWIGAYIWTFGDVFIIAMSMIMTNRFEEIKNKIYVYTNVILTPERRILKNVPIDVLSMDLEFWKEIRRDYGTMSLMCRKLNELISDIILFNIASDLCFVLFQLFTGLSRKDKFTEMLYFYFSFVYVVLRICLLSVFGGWLYEAGRAPIPMLNAVPTELYNNEISRLIHQMHYNTPCFTGKDFFNITKGLMLSVAAAIVTYELVLVQFNPNTGKLNETICF